MREVGSTNLETLNGMLLLRKKHDPVKWQIVPDPEAPILIGVRGPDEPVAMLTYGTLLYEIPQSVLAQMSNWVSNGAMSLATEVNEVVAAVDTIVSAMNAETVKSCTQQGEVQ